MAATAATPATATNGVATQPALFISHGGGPSFFFTADEMPMFSGMDKTSKTAAFLRRLREHLPAPPKAICVVSAHWEASGPGVLVQTTPKPSLYFDYYGFPPESYRYTWPAVGAPDVAARTLELLRSAGIAATADAKRGYDHGVFVPLLVAYPEGEVPVFQVSINAAYSPAFHLRLGAALAPLRKEGVLILGSGAATHNLGAMFNPSKPMEGASIRFVDYIKRAAAEVDDAAGMRLLRDVDKEPNYRAAHPEADHLMPLLVAAGAGRPAAAMAATSPAFKASTASVDAVGAGAGASGDETVGTPAGRIINDAFASRIFSLLALKFE